MLLYLYSDKLENNIKVIRKERCDDLKNELWYQTMLEYLIYSPYGKKNGCSTFEDMIAHFKHRQDLEMRIIREMIGDRATIHSAKELENRRYNKKFRIGNRVDSGTFGTVQ